MIAAFMEAFADQSILVSAQTLNADFPLDGGRFDLRRDRHADRRRRDMADVDLGSDRSLAFVEKGAQRLDAGPFDQAHHKGCRKDGGMSATPEKAEDSVGVVRV